MIHFIDGQNVYYKDEKITELVGSVNKIETERINENTVEDIEYTFIINADESGDYVEQKRTSRAEPLPLQPETNAEIIAGLRAENADLRSRVSDVEMFVADMISATP